MVCEVVWSTRALMCFEKCDLLVQGGDASPQSGSEFFMSLVGISSVSSCFFGFNACIFGHNMMGTLFCAINDLRWSACPMRLDHDSQQYGQRRG